LAALPALNEQIQVLDEKLGEVARRDERVAVVALARKLSGVLYAMWRDGSVYQPAMLKATPRRKVEHVA
jgi:hypothetical protein